jgi:hypothetical protein
LVFGAVLRVAVSVAAPGVAEENKDVALRLMASDSLGESIDVPSTALAGNSDDESTTGVLSDGTGEVVKERSECEEGRMHGVEVDGNRETPWIVIGGSCACDVGIEMLFTAV